MADFYNYECASGCVISIINGYNSLSVARAMVGVRVTVTCSDKLASCTTESIWKWNENEWNATSARTVVVGLI